MKKNDKVTTDATTTLDDEKLKKREAKKAARLAKREAKKQKEAEKKAAAKAKREEKKAKKAAKLQKEKERKAVAKQKAKDKREAKKAKKLLKLQKQKEKKAAQRAKKQAIRQKKLERLAKQKAKEKALKQKAKEKAKLQKQKFEAKSKNEVAKKPEPKQDTIDITVKLLKAYVKQAAKDDGIDDKKIKKLEKLGFTFNEDTVSFTFEAKRKVKKQIQPQVQEPEVIEPEVEIDNAIDEVIGDNGNAIEALAKELESDDEDKGTEVPVGDTYTDNTTYDSASDVDVEDDEDEDDTIDDFRDEADPDKVDFRRDWNNEFGDDGERNEDW